MTNTLSLEVTNDHAVPVEPLGGTATVLNVSGDTLYYADNPQVSAASNQGSLTAGQSQAFTSPAWVRSASLSTVQVTVSTLPGGLEVSNNTANQAANTALLQSRTGGLTFPVPTFESKTAGLVCAVDVAPSTGATTSLNNGLAWVDVCDSEALNANPYVGTSVRLGNGAKLGGTTAVGDVSTRKFGATAVPLVLAADWDGNRNPQIYLTPQTATNPNVLIGYDGSDVFTGPPAAPATTAVRGGFLYLSTVAGAPTGVPAQATTAWSAMRYDSTNHKLWVYDTVAAAWRGIALV